MRDRLGGVRFFLSAVLEVSLTRSLNFFAIFEGVPFQGTRDALTDAFAAPLAASDPGTYFRAGITFKR